MGIRPDRDSVTGPGPSVLLRSFGFARDGAWDRSVPSAALAIALEEAAGPDFSCPGATADERVGILRQWAALESFAAAGKLGSLRGMIAAEGGLQDPRDKSLAYEAAQALASSVPSTENMMALALDLAERLPGIGALLTDGILTYGKAFAVSGVFAALSAEDAAAAEALIVDQLTGKNYGQVLKLARQAAITVDPQSASRRREDAEKHAARVSLFREDSGAAGLSGRDLPTAEALAANARVNARAQAYQDSGVFPGERLDRLRAAAYLDLLGGLGARERVAAGVLPGTADPGPDDGPDDRPNDEPDDGPDDGVDSDGPDGPNPATPGPDDPGPPEPGLSPGLQTPGTAAVRLPDLILPLATLLGLAHRPGEAHGLGPLDPRLCQALAAAAAASPDSRFCVTVTDENGVAIGHGCGKLPRNRTTAFTRSTRNPQTPLPARINLTIPAARLEHLARQTGPPGRDGWSFTRERDPGPPGGDGYWRLTLPGGRELLAALEPMPTHHCDHRHESHAYQPNDRLRHLVQVRDYECTFPMCNRHARDCDFEHAVPHDKGGRTCACNAGARSRACHRVKQSTGWTVTQPQPGWHQWQTPAGRVYVQGPKRYPA